MISQSILAAPHVVYSKLPSPTSIAKCAKQTTAYSTLDLVRDHCFLPRLLRNLNVGKVSDTLVPLRTLIAVSLSRHGQLHEEYHIF